jgi:hypothetical protein
MATIYKYIGENKTLYFILPHLIKLFLFNPNKLIKYFLGHYNISYGSFQTKVYKIGGCYSVHMTKKEKLVLCENSVNSIHLRS